MYSATVYPNSNRPERMFRRVACTFAGGSFALQEGRRHAPRLTKRVTRITGASAMIGNAAIVGDTLHEAAPGDHARRECRRVWSRTSSAGISVSRNHSLAVLWDIRDPPSTDLYSQWSSHVAGLQLSRGSTAPFPVDEMEVSALR